MEERELLQYALEHGMINVSCIEEQVEMNKRKEILKKYGGCIWYSENENVWYCHLPDESKPSGRRKVKRKNKSDIENVVCEFYKPIICRDEKKSMTFSQLFADYMEHKKTQVKPVTIRRMMVDWKKFYQDSDIANKPFREITKIDVDDFLNGIAKEHSPKDKNFRNICGILKQTFEYAVDADYLDRSPYRTTKVNKKNIIPSRKKPNEKEVFTPEEQYRLTQELKRRIEEDKNYLIPCIILLNFEIGARIGEVLALSRNDIKDGRLHIRRQLVEECDVSDIDNIKNTGWSIVEYTKSDCGDRWVPLTDNAKKYIESILRIRGVGSKYLFYDPDNLITEHSVKSQLERSCERIGITPRSPHKIRKTYASRLYKNGVSISDISKLLGHADETTTLKHYIFSLEDTSQVDKKVRNALKTAENQGVSDIQKKVTKSDQKIIQFTTRIKQEKPRKIGIF